MPMEEPPWKKLKLSLERPYKDDDGEPVPVLLDITPDGQHIYEPKEDPTAKVGENLRRIFLERGIDFFDRRKHEGHKVAEPTAAQEDEGKEKHKDDAQGPKQPMTAEELFKMRMEILPQLHIALGEMCQARDLLVLLLATGAPLQATSSQSIAAQLTQPSSSQPSLSQPPPTGAQLPPSALSATVATKPPPISSVQAFNAQLVVGGKDRALRKAADMFKSAAESIEAGRVRSERYWLDALKIRRGNWGLVPAPLPFGSSTGRGADRTAKDFLVSFGLEESPALFRRRAIGRMPTIETDQSSLEFPLRQRARLQVSFYTTDAYGNRLRARNRMPVPDESTLAGSLRAAQAEVVEQEIFAALIREASSLPTASARVSERLIVIEAAQGTELRFELVRTPARTSELDDSSDAAICDLIFSSLHVLLLRAHALLRTERLMRTSSHRTQAQSAARQSPVVPPILQPVIDMLMYQDFCERVKSEVGRFVAGLQAAGVRTGLQFTAVGGSGEEFVRNLRTERPRPIEGQALIRVDNRHTLRFTFISPSTLIAHLPQATLQIMSIPQLTQLLTDDIGGCLLKRICDIGAERCGAVNGTWFVDVMTGQAVGRWEGCAL
ncbi:hypothetical protein WOLCODRAFT_88978 [Wolfiporia cocos MD-104 SS10]|uniref:Mediator of RNA polymerase II transcription subunit 17 n=1 Tax=Wolfiporia cocos (strain MD-104) TaxID=742152 RepID=A0A2H3JGK6_WOLCO|nr:hypothetical protein WOLCODRAFT_88978 [Wolfiporia cocos MD-104 SS10]